MTSQSNGTSPSLNEVVRGFMLESLGGFGRTDEVNEVKALLEEHFGTDDLNQFPTVGEGISWYLHAAFQLGLDKYLAEPGRTSRQVGVLCPSVTNPQGQAPLRQLLAPSSTSWSAPVLTQVDHVKRAIGVDEYLPCIRWTMVLTRDENGPAALWFQAIGGSSPEGGGIALEVMASSHQHGVKILGDLTAASKECSPYRGKVITFVKVGCAVLPRFTPRPPQTDADDLILPAGVLAKIDRHAIGIGEAREQLAHVGQHLKRGVLLFGPPGTGKTHTIRYLVNRMPEAGVVIAPGSKMTMAQGFLPALIDYLVPGVVVFDDVDLIAEDRSKGGRGNPALFNLLDMLDGLGEDRDMLFVFTTNRADQLEPAFAARPGRIDQAIEIGLPDADCRTRLFELYANGLDWQVKDLAKYVDQTQGVTASFIRELLRRAALLAARDDDSTPIRVTDDHLEAAIQRMLDPDNPLTELLLGGQRPKRAQRIRIVGHDGAAAEDDDDDSLVGGRPPAHPTNGEVDHASISGVPA